MVQLTEEPIDGTGLNQFIMKPLGNGEVNIMKMSTTIITTHYLDITEQWEKIGVDRRADALNLIMQGKRFSYQTADPYTGSCSLLACGYSLSGYCMSTGLVRGIVAEY